MVNIGSANTNYNAFFAFRNHQGLAGQNNPFSNFSVFAASLNVVAADGQTFTVDNSADLATVDANAQLKNNPTGLVILTNNASNFGAIQSYVTDTIAFPALTLDGQTIEASRLVG